MSRGNAPTKATGGGGYTFADKVAAGFVAQMLKRAFPVEPEFGPIEELHFSRCGADPGRLRAGPEARNREDAVRDFGEEQSPTQQGGFQ